MASSSFNFEIYFEEVKGVDFHLDRLTSSHQDDVQWMGLTFSGTGSGSMAKLPSIMTQLPPVLLLFVVRVVIEDRLPSHIARTIGKYSLRTANAELIQDFPRSDYKLHLEAARYEDAAELYQGILSRKINVTESWE